MRDAAHNTDNTPIAFPYQELITYPSGGGGHHGREATVEWN